MARRIASTLVLWALVAVTVIYFGRTGTAVVCALFAAAAQNELYLMLEKLGQRPFRHLGVALGLLLVLMPVAARELVDTDAKEGMESALVAITIVACCLRVMRERTGPPRFETLISTVFGLVYVPFMLFFIVRITWLGPDETAGLMLMLWLLFAAKFCDVGALAVGTLIGRHKIAPSMSPAKTWEGAIGGVIVAAGMCAALVAVFPRQFPPGFTPLVSALAAIVPAIVSITSDLIESVIKRMAGMKDSGATIPGIGGAFDLVDSLILSAPVGYLILRVLV